MEDGLAAAGFCVATGPNRADSVSAERARCGEVEIVVADRRALGRPTHDRAKASQVGYHPADRAAWRLAIGLIEVVLVLE